MFYWVQQGGSPSLSSFFFCFLSIGGPANLCDSVATECLPAAECSALQQPLTLPSPLARSLAASLQILTDWLPSYSSSHRPPSQEQLFQNWPTCIKFTTTAAPESVLSNLHFHSLCLLQGSL
ncbi:hypothetical protein PAMA_009397 [Pampus argenteus]